MWARAFRAVAAALILMAALPGLAAAQNWRVRDTLTGVNVIPGSGVSDLGDVQVGFIAQRIYQVFNQTTSSPATLGPCSISGSSAFIIANGTGGVGSVYPGVPTGLHIQFASNTLGNHQASVFCSGSIGNFSYIVRGRVLDANPFIILQTLAGANVAKNSTFSFGTVQAGTAADRDFKIINLGNQALTVSLSTTNPAYSVVTAPPSSIARGGEATFRLRLLSAATGTITGQLRITNNDPNDNPYNVNLTASVSAAPTPQIQVTDNGNGGATVIKGSTVNLGTTTPNTVVTRTFTVRNTGNASLSITNPSTFLSGTGFSISSFPSSSVGSGGGTTTFTVRFQAATSTSYVGTVSLSNNDLDDNPFFFNLAITVGSAPVPRIRVVNNTTGQTIVPGSTTISFGSPAPNVSVTHSFTIFNDGGGTLTLSNPTSFVSGTGFTLSSTPASSLLGGGNTNFSIRFQGGTAGAYSGSASLLHNDATVANPLGFSLQANVAAVLPTVTLAVGDAETSETPSNNGSVTLSRTGSTAAALSVNLGLSGSAVNGSDYTSIATTQTFGVGQSTLTLSVVPVNDTAIEDVESAVVTVAAGSGYNVGSPSNGTVSIYNDDFTACTPAAARLCLQGGRFEATLSALAGTTPYTGQAVPLTNSSGGFWLFSPNNVEVGVKVLDAAALAGKMWVFHGAATDVSYTLTVADRANPSRVRTFNKAAGSYCGGADTGFFVKSAGLPEDEAALTFDAVPASSVKAFTCVANSTTTCLLGNRFQVRLKLGTVYQPVVQATSQTGFFWFNNADNLEVFVKLLDGTGFNGKYWVFLGAMTDQGYTVEVTDSVTSVQKTYTQPGPFCGLGDTAAF
jgi:hypothetical protein